MNASLVMFAADGTRRDFPLKKDRVVLGRNKSCDVWIPLPAVSRNHCELRVESQTVILRDLGSLNGTICNNERILEETDLDAGDQIVIGPVVFTLTIDGHPQQIEPMPTILRSVSENDGD